MRFFLPWFRPLGAACLLASIGWGVPHRSLPGGKPEELPLVFEENLGQAPRPARFTVRISGCLVGFEPGGLSLARRPGGHFLRLRFLGSRANAVLQGLEPTGGRSHYLLGRDPKAWLQSVPHYARIAYRRLYPGVDAIFYGRSRRLEFDLLLEPGAKADGFRLGIEGAEAVWLDREGNLRVRAGQDDFTLYKPKAYQQSESGHAPVAVAYVMEADREVSLRVGDYDRSKPLVIDPVLSYSTLLGGLSDEVAHAVVADGSARAYVAGYTASVGFPTSPGAYQAAHGGGARDAFVARLNSLGTAFEYVTYLGGSGDDIAYGLAVDGLGNAFVAGSTASTDFPTTTGALRRKYAGGLGRVHDGFECLRQRAGVFDLSGRLGRGYRLRVGSDGFR